MHKGHLGPSASLGFLLSYLENKKNCCYSPIGKKPKEIVMVSLGMQRNSMNSNN